MAGKHRLRQDEEEFLVILGQEQFGRDAVGGCQRHLVAGREPGFAEGLERDHPGGHRLDRLRDDDVPHQDAFIRHRSERLRLFRTGRQQAQGGNQEYSFHFPSD